MLLQTVISKIRRKWESFYNPLRETNQTNNFQIGVLSARAQIVHVMHVQSEGMKDTSRVIQSDLRKGNNRVGEYI